MKTDKKKGSGRKRSRSPKKSPKKRSRSGNRKKKEKQDILNKLQRKPELQFKIMNIKKRVEYLINLPTNQWTSEDYTFMKKARQPEMMNLIKIVTEIATDKKKR